MGNRWFDHVADFHRFISFKIDNKYGPCEERSKIQFKDRFLEWLAITQAEEQAFEGFDAVAFTKNLRLNRLGDSEISELQTVCVFCLA